MGTPDPFLYFDFRLWFRDFLVDHSYSQVIVALGLKSKGHITQILQGKRNATPMVAEKIADLADLQGRPRLFLLALVEFTQAKTHDEKKQCLDRMILLQNSDGRVLSAHHYDLCKQWYYPVVRELVRIVPVHDNYQQLARMVSPPISERAAETAIKDLERMGLIVRVGKKGYAQTDAILTFGEGWKSVAVREFQMQALDLQKKAFDQFVPEERELSNATVCMSRERAALVKKRLQLFRKELMELVRSDPKDPEQVFQLNIGFFPMSREKIK